MSVDVARLRALLAEVPTAPWKCGPDGYGMYEVTSAELHPDGAEVGIGNDLRRDDAELIALAINALPELLAAYEATHRRHRDPSTCAHFCTDYGRKNCFDCGAAIPEGR